MKPLNIKPQGKTYKTQDGNIRYLDSGHLNRPITMPKSQVGIMMLFLAVGIVIAVALFMHINDAVFGSAERKQAAIEANITREVSYNVPVLSSLITLDDNSIKQSFTDAGLAMYEYSDPNDYPNGGFMQACFPADIDFEQAQAWFDTGISSLDAPDAAMLLNGMWTFNLNRLEYLDMRVRYADFVSGSLEAAINAAMEQQGFSSDSILTENGAGIDESGNTYKAGTIEIGGTTYQWRVSAAALQAVYDIRGLPEDAVYVGIRITE